MRRLAAIAVVSFAVLFCGAADRARAQQRWWERPEAPPAEHGGGDGTEAGEAGEGGEAPASPRPQPSPPAAPPSPDEVEPPVETAPTVDPTAAPVLGGLDTTWRWQQVLASPRIGARLSAVAIDPSNPNRIFVGTEEGTILRSTDGGITWSELEMSPFVTTRRQFSIVTPGLPKLGETSIGSLELRAFPPFQGVPADIIDLPLVTPVQFSTVPEFMSVIYPRPPAPGVTLLSDAIRARPTVPVHRIAVCPGAAFPLLVATDTELDGSTDDGLTYVRLLRLPGGVTVHQVACSRTDPSHMLLATSFGAFISKDGGATFDPDLSGRPGNPVEAIAFGPSPGGGRERAYVSNGSDLWAGDPESEGGLQFVYPDFNNSATAPWGDIMWVETTADGEVWLATTDGIRFSPDYGHNFVVPARSLFERQGTFQIAIGENEHGGRRVAVQLDDCPLPNRCRNSLVYASDDGGESWFPFFQGATRRTLYQMAVAPSAPGIPPRWWIATGGELWATTVPPPDRDDIDADSQHWARAQLRRTPDLDDVIDSVLDGTDLSRGHVDDLLSSVRERNWIPRVQVLFNYVDTSANRTAAVTPVIGNPPSRDLGTNGTDAWFIYAWAEWSLRDVPIVSEDLSPTRNDIYELRRQISFVAEDAWHERVIQLRRIADGMSDRLQVEILKERITALEAVLETWMGRPLSSLPRGHMRIAGGNR